MKPCLEGDFENNQRSSTEYCLIPTLTVECVALQTWLAFRITELGSVMAIMITLLVVVMCMLGQEVKIQSPNTLNTRSVYMRIANSKFTSLQRQVVSHCRNVPQPWRQVWRWLHSGWVGDVWLETGCPELRRTSGVAEHTTLPHTRAHNRKNLFTFLTKGQGHCMGIGRKLSSVIQKLTTTK